MPSQLVPARRPRPIITKSIIVAIITNRGITGDSRSSGLSLWRARGPATGVSRLPRITRRSSREKGAEFAPECAADAAVSAGNVFACCVCLRETLGRARSQERGGCVAPPNATNFGDKVEPVVLDSLSSVAPAHGVGATRATPSRARGGEICIFGCHRSFSEHENRMETSLKSEQIGVNRSSEFNLV